MATQVDGTFVVMEMMPAAKNLLECVVGCQARSLCKAFQFDEETHGCQSLDAAQLIKVDTGGKMIYIQDGSTCKMFNYTVIQLQLFLDSPSFVLLF